MNHLEESTEGDSQPKRKTSPKSREETAILVYNIIARRPVLFNTNPQIVVLLVCHSLLHKAAVEHIDFEQIILNGFLRHVIKQSCFLLHKVLSNRTLVVCNLTLYFSATQSADEVVAG